MTVKEFINRLQRDLYNEKGIKPTNSNFAKYIDSRYYNVYNWIKKDRIPASGKSLIRFAFGNDVFKKHGVE